MAGVLAMIAALEERVNSLSNGEAEQRLAMRVSFEERLARALPAVQIVGPATERLWNTVSVIMPELPDCRQRWVVKLDRLGFAVSTGSACASGKEQISHVLSAMSFGAGEASRALRFSSGWETKDERLVSPARRARTGRGKLLAIPGCRPSLPPRLRNTRLSARHSDSG